MQNKRTYGTRVGTRGAIGFRARLSFQAKTSLRALAIGVMAVGALAAFNKTADASSTAVEGFFLGAFSGNTNPIDNVQQVLDEIVNPNIEGTAVFYAKGEINDDGIGLGGTGPRGTLTLSNLSTTGTNGGTELFSGDWAFAPDDSFDPLPLVTILAIKAGNFFGLWLYNDAVPRILDPLDQHGLFDVSDLSNAVVCDSEGQNCETVGVHGISHISVYGNVTVTNIPLPAALPLFLTALAGLGGMSYRRRRKQASAAA